MMDNDTFYKNIFPKRKKILQVGPYPPPLGGVSVSLYRLIKLLEEYNREIDYFDTSKIRFSKLFLYLRLISKIIFGKYKIIHLHFNDIIVFYLLLILKKYFLHIDIVFTSHNPRLFDSLKGWRKKICTNFIENLDVLIVVGEHILNKYKSEKIDLPKNIFVKDPFIKPPLNEEKQIIETYPKSLIDFIDKHSPVISANAFQIVFFENKDLYGLDMCVNLVYKLKNIFPNIGFVFALANDEVNNDYIYKIKQRIKILNISTNFYFLRGQKELWPLFKKIDLMLRPTLTDGNPVSISEALFFDCPTIASNVCERPLGTTIFISENLEDLMQKSIDILSS